MKPPLEPHFFRHEYGRLVAMLTRRFGVHHLDVVEDAVQNALLTAVETWPRGAIPENPSAWLYSVAYRQCAGSCADGHERTRWKIGSVRAHRAQRTSRKPLFLQGRCATIFFGCSSPVATTPFRSNLSWYSR